MYNEANSHFSPVLALSMQQVFVPGFRAPSPPWGASDRTTLAEKRVTNTVRHPDIDSTIIEAARGETTMAFGR